MAGKLSANAIESGTLSASKLDASLNSSFNNYQPATGVTITDISYTNANANIILTGKNFDENCEIYIIGDNSINYTDFTRTNANSISLVYPLANLSSLYTSNAAIADDYLRIQVKNPDSSVAVSTIRIFSSFQGTVAGYMSGGFTYPPTLTTRWNVIEKFPFAASTLQTDIGDLTQTRDSCSGQNSDVSGYTSGGTAPTTSDIIDKFPFVSDGNATDVGDLTQSKAYTAGHSSTTNGYVSGDTIEKFPFASDSNATDVGNLTQARSGAAGQSSQTHGYSSGGSSYSNIIDKFPFATDSNATDVGDLTSGRGSIYSGQSSITHGYTSGGITPVPFGPFYGNSVTSRNKFSFGSDENATSLTGLSIATHGATGVSSAERGYHLGGHKIQYPPFPAIATQSARNSFPFASDDDISSIGSLSNARGFAAGQQS